MNKSTWTTTTMRLFRIIYGHENGRKPVSQLLGEKSLATFFLSKFYFCRVISLLLADVQPCNFWITFLQLSAKGQN